MNKTRLIKHKGQTMTLKDWAKELNIAVGSLRNRLTIMSVPEALTPRKLKRYSYHGRVMSMEAIANEAGCKTATLRAEIAGMEGKPTDIIPLDTAIESLRKRGLADQGTSP